jgi:ribosomal protein S18 acetylase RimI-like enzyme
MNNLLNIRLAHIEDLDNINLLFKRVVDDIHDVKKINMWNTEYPFCEFEKDIKNQNMYVIENDNKIIGSFALTTFDDPEYHVINWTSNDKKWFYINRLVIHPNEQGKGYAKKAMQFIDDYAIKNNYEVIRLTVHKDNKYAIGLYEKFGFIKIENSYWIIGEKVFIGYEKKVK